MRKKEDLLKERMKDLHINEEDLVENFILGSGSGGQKINKTSSCVQLKHIPTGIEFKVQKYRSREANRIFAREELCRKLELRIEMSRKEKEQKLQKIKRSNRKPSFGQKQRRRTEKKKKSEKKLSRKPIRSQHHE